MASFGKEDRLRSVCFVLLGVSKVFLGSADVPSCDVCFNCLLHLEPKFSEEAFIIQVFSLQSRTQVIVAGALLLFHVLTRRVLVLLG